MAQPLQRSGVRIPTLFSSAESMDDAVPEMVRNISTMLERILLELPSAGTPDMPALIRALAGAGDAKREELRLLQEALYRDQLSIWRQVMAPDENHASMAFEGNDHRFDAPEWNLPYFRYLKHAYLLNARFLQQLGELAEIEPHARRRLKFQLRQMADAMSPSNFAATNPEVIQLGAASGGKSFAQGMKLLSDDIARGHISMTDERAFAVGRDLAITPGAVVFENKVMQLIQYAPSTPEVHEFPLLIVPPFINKFYILDLQPENSFVRFCVEQGFSTFIVSWRNVSPDQGHLGWADYIEKGVLGPLDAIRSISKSRKINTLGFCVGGTLLACALAVLAARKDNPARSLTLLAAMLDFSDTGDISVYVDRDYVERNERKFEQPGVMPGTQLASTFATLRANDLIWNFVISNYLKGRSPRAFDLLYWNADGSNLPGRLYTYYLRNMYLENNLKVPGRLEACGVPMDLGSITAPAYIVATQDDHIVPWKSAYASVGLLGGPSEFVLGASGHVAGIVNPASKDRRHFWLSAPAKSDADSWLAGATQQTGTWWKHWAQWLRKQSGRRKLAPEVLGNRQYPALEPAPGSYVREKSA